MAIRPTRQTQIPITANDSSLADPDTPSNARVHMSFNDGPEWRSAFSDEFNVGGRSFWPGDGPCREAANLHYWQMRHKLYALRSFSPSCSFHTDC